MSLAWDQLPLRRLAECWDYVRIPLNAEERHERPGDVPYWGANTVQGHVNEALVSEEVVLIGEDGAPFFDRSRPVAFRIDEPIWPNNHIHVLKPKPGVDARWLAYALNNVDYSLYVLGSTRDKLTQGALMQITMLVPPTDIQVAIADRLDSETRKLEQLIAEQRRLIALLQERQKAVMGEAASRTNGTQVKLKYLFQPSKTANHPNEQVLSVYRDFGVLAKSSRTDNSNRTPEDLTRYLLVHPDDLVVNRMKAWQGALAISNVRGIVSADYEVLRPTASDLESAFAHIYLRSPQMIVQYALRSTGIRPAQWRLYWEQMGAIAIPVPRLVEQRAIIDWVKKETGKMGELIEGAKSLIALVQERKEALIAALVASSDEVRLDNAGGSKWFARKT